MIDTIYATVESYARHTVYLIWKTAYRAEKVKNICRMMERYVFPEMGQFELRKVLSSDVNRCLMEARREDGTKTAYQLRNALDELFCCAQENRLIGRTNPVEDALPMDPPERVLRVLTEQEIQAVLMAGENAENGIAAIISVVYGLDIRKIVALRRHDLDWEGKEAADRGMVHISRIMHGRNLDPLVNGKQDIAVGKGGMQLFDQLVATPMDLSDTKRLILRIRNDSGVSDFSYRMAQDSFIMRKLQQGMMPVELRDYYGELSCRKYFYYMEHYLGDKAWDGE